MISETPSPAIPRGTSSYIWERLKTIPDNTIRANALRNYRRKLKRAHFSSGGLVTSMHHAIDAMAGWSTTPEGADYWSTIYNNYIANND